MDMYTSPTDWRTALKEQGRSISWLAIQTERPRRSLYAYSQGTMRPTSEWLARASAALGLEVCDERYTERKAA